MSLPEVPHNDPDLAEAVRVLDIKLARKGMPALTREQRESLRQDPAAFELIDRLEDDLGQLADPRALVTTAHCRAQGLIEEMPHPEEAPGYIEFPQGEFPPGLS